MYYKYYVLQVEKSELIEEINILLSCLEDVETKHQMRQSLQQLAGEKDVEYLEELLNNVIDNDYTKLCIIVND